MTHYNRIALTRELPGDLDTPVGAYLKLAHRPYSFLLESMVGGEQWGRYSFIGLPSREVLRVVGHDITVTRDGETVETARIGDPLPWIRAYADNFTETKTDFFEMRNASYKKTSVDNGFDDL